MSGSAIIENQSGNPFGDIGEISVINGSLPDPTLPLLSSRDYDSSFQLFQRKFPRLAFQFSSSVSGGQLSVVFTSGTTQRTFLLGATYATAGLLQSGTVIVPQGFTANFYYSSVTGSYDLTVREIGP
ncbi:hypothetical protein [Methanoregula sp.]|jgi:hypothetical protein|uniref:hypothetical protein n=1 Tax=Methanoregula sp. TaxID=2052170 RepID=UPI003C72B8D0